MEIQREIEELVQGRQDEAVKAKIKSYDLCTKEDSAMRKRAGLYGISVITVALYQKVRDLFIKIKECYTISSIIGGSSDRCFP